MSKTARIERQKESGQANQPTGKQTQHHESGQANSVIESAFAVGCLSLSIFMLLVFFCALILLICG